MNKKAQLPIELKLKDTGHYLCVPDYPIKKVVEAIESRQAVIAVTGSDGTGKTTVLAHCVSVLREKGYDFVLVRGKTEPELIVKELLLKIRDSGNLEAEQIFLSTSSLEAKWGWVAENYLASGKLVVILDNFEDNLTEEGDFSSPQLKAMMSLFQDALKRKDVSLLVSSSLDIEGFDTVEIDELSLEEFVEGMGRLTRLSGIGSGIAEDLYGEIGGNPLVMRLLDSVVWFENKNEAGGEVSWADLKRSISGLKLTVARKRRRGEELIRLFTVRILTHLEPAQLSLIRTLSAYRFPVGRSALEFHSLVVSSELRAAVLESGLLEYDPESERYSVHPAVGSVVLTEMAKQERRGLHRECGRFFENLKDPQGNKSMDDILEARRHFIEAGAWDAAAEATFGLGDYLDRIGFLDFSFRLLLEIHGNELNEKNRAAADYAMGNLYTRYGRLAEARESLARALKVWEKTGEDSNVPLALRQIGYVHSLEKNYDQALEFYNRAMERFGESSDETERSRSQHQIALILRARGDDMEALELFRQSVEVMEKNGDEAGVAASYLQMGQIYQSTGDMDAALDHFEHSLDICRGMNDEAGTAIRHYFIAQAHEAGGDLKGALRDYIEAWKVFSRLSAVEAAEAKQRIIALKDKLSRDEFAAILADTRCNAEDFDPQNEEQQEFIEFIHRMTQQAVYFAQLPGGEKERTVELLNNMIANADYDGSGMESFKTYFQMLLAYIYHEDIQRFRPLIPSDLWALFQRTKAGI